MRSMSPGVHMTFISTAGLPFFMTIGVAHASAAPSARHRSMVCAISSGVRSSTLVVSTAVVWTSGRSCPALPEEVLADVSSRRIAVRTFGYCSGSRPPAPRASPAMVPLGRGPNSVAIVVSRAAPVGVTVSASTSTGVTSAPMSSAAVAGAGIGSRPWAATVVPWPMPIGPQVTCSTSSRQRAIQEPTMSTIASTAPTS